MWEYNVRQVTVTVTVAIASGLSNVHLGAQLLILLVVRGGWFCGLTCGRDAVLQQGLNGFCLF